MSNLSTEQMAKIELATYASSNLVDKVFHKSNKLSIYATTSAALASLGVATASIITGFTGILSLDVALSGLSILTGVTSLGAAYLLTNKLESGSAQVSLADYRTTFKVLDTFGIYGKEFGFSPVSLESAQDNFRIMQDKHSKTPEVIGFINSVHKLSMDTPGSESISRDRLVKIAQETIYRSEQLAEVKSSWLDKVKNVALGLMGAAALAAAGMGLSSNANAAQVVVDTPAQTYEAVSSKASVFANDQDIAQEMMTETIKQMIKSSLSSPNDQALVEKGFSEMINNGMFDNALTLNDKKELILDNQILAENLPDSYAKTLADGNSDEKIVSLVAGVIAQTIQSDLGADNKLEQKIAQVLADHQSQQKPDDQQSIAKQGQQLAQDFAKYSPEIKDASLSM